MCITPVYSIGQQPVEKTVRLPYAMKVTVQSSEKNENHMIPLCSML